MIAFVPSSKISFKGEDMYRLLIQKAIEAWKRLQPLFLRWLSGAPPWTSAREHSQKGAACHSPPSHALNSSRQHKKSTPCSNSSSRSDWRFKSLHCNPILEAQNKIGMKVHSGTDVGTGYVYTITVPPANVHDIAQYMRWFTKIIVVSMEIRAISVWKRTEIREKPDLSGVDYRIAQRPSQNRMTKEYKRTNWDMRIKHAKASVWSKVEDPLLMVRRCFYAGKTRYREHRKNLL